MGEGKGSKEKPLTLPPVREVHRARPRLSPIAKGPKVQEVSHNGEVCKPAPLGTWHDSVVGEKKSQQVFSLSSRNQVLACGRAGRCGVAWSTAGTASAASCPYLPLLFKAGRGSLPLFPSPPPERGVIQLTAPTSRGVWSGAERPAQPTRGLRPSVSRAGRRPPQRIFLRDSRPRAPPGPAQGPRARQIGEPQENVPGRDSK